MLKIYIIHHSPFYCLHGLHALHGRWRLCLHGMTPHGICVLVELDHFMAFIAFMAFFFFITFMAFILFIGAGASAAAFIARRFMAAFFFIAFMAFILFIGAGASAAAFIARRFMAA